MVKARLFIRVVALLLTVMLGACNLSKYSASSEEVALAPATMEVRATRTLIEFNQPTATFTPLSLAAPTITVLGSGQVASQPTAQNLNVGVVPTQAPPQGICSARPMGNYDVNVRSGPGAEYDVTALLHAGQYAPVLSRSDIGWLRVNMDTRGQGWVSPKVVSLFGPCDNLRVDVVSAPQSVTVEPSMTPTPTAQFGFTMNIPLNHLVTKVDVGSIPAGTTVMVTTTQFTGTGYLYGIITADGRGETATDDQLEYRANGGASPFSTLTTTPQANFAPTPYAAFQSEIGMHVYRVKTLVNLGDIPAGTAVRLSSAVYNGALWLYDIVTQTEVHATASESQLAYIPNAGGGGPTPTIPVTPPIPVMSLPTDISPSDVVIPDGLCTVTAKSTTSLVKQPASAIVVGILNPGPWAQVDATDTHGWYKITISLDGSQGWATTDTLSLHGPCDKLPIAVEP